MRRDGFYRSAAGSGGDEPFSFLHERSAAPVFADFDAKAALPEFYGSSLAVVRAAAAVPAALAPLAPTVPPALPVADVLATAVAPDRLDALLAPHIFQPGEVPRVDVPVAGDTPAAAPAAIEAEFTGVGPVAPVVAATAADADSAIPAASALFVDPVPPLTQPVPHAFLDIAQHNLSSGPAIATIVPGFEDLPPPPVIG